MKKDVCKMTPFFRPFVRHSKTFEGNDVYLALFSIFHASFLSLSTVLQNICFIFVFLLYELQSHQFISFHFQLVLNQMGRGDSFIEVN